MSNNNDSIDFDEWLNREAAEWDDASEELKDLLKSIGQAARQIYKEIANAGLAGMLGSEGRMNVQGEEVQKMDARANQIFIDTLQAGGACAGIVSEENEHVVVFDDGKSLRSEYVFLMDPIDGSGNIDVNISIGSIFSIYRRLSSPGSRVTEQDFLQPGKNQVAAGYFLYGPTINWILATTNSVNGFTLSRPDNRFFLSSPHLKAPLRGPFYSFDNHNYNRVDQSIRNYVNYCMSDTQNTYGPYSNRYYGCMVADVHRNLLKGGIYFYPQTKDKPNGKLRICYECNPMAFIIEKAGGSATDGRQRILEIHPEHIHQRSPLFIGSREMVKELIAFGD